MKKINRFCKSIALACIGVALMMNPVMAKENRVTEEKRISLSKNEISQNDYVTGGVVGTLLGFGSGTAIQGRYWQRGWIFTAGEAGSAAIMVAGLSSAWNYDFMPLFAGAAAFVGFRIWEIVDLWVAPSVSSDHDRDPKNGTRKQNVSYYLVPMNDHFQTGIAFRF